MKISSLNTAYLASAVKFAVVAPFALFYRVFKKNVWIITERPGQARDNGYVFFEYLRTRHPEMNAYYIIDKSQPDYNKIKQYGNVIQFDSWKHYFYYCLSKVHISAHVNGCKPSDSPICKRLKAPLSIRDVFLPHGVSYGVSEFCLKKYANLDLFICSGRREYENVLKNYGYAENEVVYTGFPRLDKWHDIQVNKKQIVLMPTWRFYLAQNPDVVFEKTNYFKAYKDLIDNKKLCDFLLSNDLKMVFYLHNDMRKYTGFFNTECKNIEIVNNDDACDIQELLKSSAVLITDYSSVHFDFAYMKKPVLYYQFDKEEFAEKQYSQGLFDTEREGFGKVSYDCDTLVDNLIDSYKNSFDMSTKYYNRMRMFYELYDNENCMRVYNEIMKRL